MTTEYSSTWTTSVEPTWLMRTSENMPVANSRFTASSMSAFEKFLPGLDAEIAAKVVVVDALIAPNIDAADDGRLRGRHGRKLTRQRAGTTSAAERATAETALLKLEAAFIWLSKPFFLVVPTARKPDVAA